MSMIPESRDPFKTLTVARKPAKVVRPRLPRRRPRRRRRAVQGGSSTWPSWTDSHVWNLTPRRTKSDNVGVETLSDSDFRAWQLRQAAEFSPTPEEDGERAGFELGMAGESCPSRMDYSVPYTVALAREGGWLSGDRERRRRERSEAEYAAWVADRPELNHDEMVRAAGVHAARQAS